MEADIHSSAALRAKQFIDRERQFRLGALPTEQSHPKTTALSDVIRADLPAGIRLLQAVDAADLPPVARRVFAGREFEALTERLARAVADGHRIFLSGCGATGRVSILLEAAWRRAWRRAPEAWRRAWPDAAGAVRSIMTGGDYALVRSVEFFEDYTAFGRRQMAEAGIGPGDALVAITEGGETSSVIGTVWQGLEAGAGVFFVFNNPAPILAEHVERSRAVIRDPRVVCLDLASGPMAIAGSTRMQATTLEILVVGAALELALARLGAARGLALPGAPGSDPGAFYGGRLQALLDALARPAAVQALAGWTAFEEALYAGRGAVTYLASRCLLDIFTDTTERAPTFMLPPFRRCDDAVSPRSWAFVKHPLLETPAAWRDALAREPRCLEWTPEIYRQMGAPEPIWKKPPAIGVRDLESFRIGREPDASRHAAPSDAALLVLAGPEAAAAASPGDPLAAAASAAARPFPRRLAAGVGPEAPPAGPDWEGGFHVACEPPDSPLSLWERLAVKLALNTVSTATMARLGRVRGNWMVHVETTNKKLVDRGTRIIQHFTGLSYDDACLALHETLEEQQARPAPGGERRSPVADTLARLEREGRR